MKTFLCCVVLCCFYSITANARPPQKIYSITRQNLSADYYFKQAALWKAELDLNNQNKEAWFNYFMANHILFEKGKISLPALDQINNALQEILPRSFEAYFATYSIQKDIQFLLKAYELAPNRYETYPDLMLHYKANLQEEKVVGLCQKWLASGEYSNGLLHWNYNMLAGLAEHAILLTEGDNYTHPLWLLQQGKGIRQDIQVLNLQLLTNPTYRNAVFKQLDIPALVSNEKPDIVQHLSQSHQKRALYLGVSISKALVKNYEEELYIVGLAFRHSTDEFDNISALVDNYEQYFLLDYLKTDLNYDISQDIVNQTNVNYLPAFLILHDYYQENKEWDKANQIRNLSLRIADSAEKGEELRAYLGNNFQTGDSKTMVEISHKEIEENFMLLPYNLNLYAGATEVTNKAYELFLTDLLKRKEFDLLQAHKIYKTDWRSYLPVKFQNLAEDHLYAHGSPNAPDAPIQNISYESATAFCDWLTAVYNNIEHKKKEFKRVRFRLPTEKEWMLAASTLSPNADTSVLFEHFKNKYPWGDSYVKNAQGCFLANLNTSNEIPKEAKDAGSPALDGAYFTVMADAYFPNNYGLFNTVGNVAEMVQEKGKAKGGSWFHSVEVSNLQNVQMYTEPQPYIGFRVFMEVLEEGTQDKIRKGMLGPPATLHLQGNLYMDEHELTNMDWQEYSYWIKQNEPEKYFAISPDTSAWNSLGTQFTPFVQQYHKHPTYNSYPVVGVTHEQATNYCKWRSKVVNEMLALNPNGQKKFGTVLYRLPTQKEWEYAASGGLDKRDFPYGHKELTTSKGDKKVYLNWSEGKRNQQQDSTATASVYSFTPNGKGYYNMIGNVAEMVAEKGIAKGGSWRHALSQSKITTKLSYDVPTPWLGFRCICEVGL
jgi:formylglycine-generating enzyme required for sulfatase activity